MTHPPGKAHHWMTETIYRASIDPLLPCDEPIGVATSIDSPRLADGTRIQDYGNQYYGTFVQVEVFGERLTLRSEHARRLASALMCAADVADAHDAPLVDACGHYGPCGCRPTKGDE